MDPEKGTQPASPANKFKLLALCSLTLQSSLLILTMRYSRMNSEGGGQYTASTAVFFSELLKLLICTIESTRQVGLAQTFRQVHSSGHQKLAVPAALYVLQNHLQYVAASNLDAGTLQVAYQLKILTTAVFFVLFMHRSLRLNQWLALLLLATGVAVMQIAPLTAQSHSPAPGDVGNRSVGIFAVVWVCILSGAASVYFESCVKNNQQEISLWVRNIQLGLYSILPVILVAAFGSDGKIIRERGILYGYTGSTYAVILLQAAGGILVANVVKYADSILKNFATSISIILSTCVSHSLWKTPLTIASVLGASLVIFSTYWFNTCK